MALPDFRGGMILVMFAPTPIGQDHSMTSPTPIPANASPVVATIDVREVPHFQRHALIYKTFDSLQPGQAFMLVVDHDPKPVIFELDFMHKGKFAYAYVEQGPLWRIRMSKTS